MTDSSSDSSPPGRGKRKHPAAFTEALALLERLRQDHPAARLDADLVLDAVLDLYRTQSSQIRHLANRLRRITRRRQRLHDRLVVILHELATGTVVLPGIPGRPVVPHDQLLDRFRQLRQHDFPGLAARLQAVAGRASLPAYQRFLTDEVLLQGNEILAEHLLRHHRAHRTTERIETEQSVEQVNLQEEEAFLADLRHHLAGNVCRGLGRKVGYQVTPEVGVEIDTVIGRTLVVLLDLITATPPGRLLLPATGTPFDPERHEPLPGRPASGTVQATLFPGYLLLESPPRILEKALVVTGPTATGKVRR